MIPDATSICIYPPNSINNSIFRFEVNSNATASCFKVYCIVEAFVHRCVHHHLAGASVSIVQ